MQVNIKVKLSPFIETCKQKTPITRKFKNEKIFFLQIMNNSCSKRHNFHEVFFNLK